MTAYYNEFDRQKAAWLRELIKVGAIATGEVDERSIKDVRPDDLRGYTQCHFFAGIGVWSYAMRLAGWPDDRPVWTGSCPCQSFSVAGQRKGFADERHLWPEWFRLADDVRPNVIFGEQVASVATVGRAGGAPADGVGPAWIDLVFDDLEGASYSVGAVAFPACGFGAPHIRQRLYFVGNLADAPVERRQWWRPGEASDESRSVERSERLCNAGGLEHAEGDGRQQRRSEPGGGSAEPRCGDGGVGDTGRPGLAERQRSGQHGQQPEDGGVGQLSGRTGPTNGRWGSVDWIRCTDGKWRPVEPGSQPLAHGTQFRVAKLRGFGDAIVAPAAAHFIQAYMKARS